MILHERELFENILSHYEVKKISGNNAQCVCPCHDDKQASLSISMGNKGILFRCFAGCDTEDILSAKGLKLKNTFYDSKPDNSEVWKQYVEKREKKKIEAVYNYVSIESGNYAFTKLRLEGKSILYGRIENNRFIYGLPRNTPRKSLKAVYGNLKALNKAITEGKAIFIPEGEKDVDSLTKQGYAAFTYGGCSDWQFEFAELTKGADVYILADNDESGLAVAKTILKDIEGVSKSAKIIVPVPDVAKADISDYFQAGHTKEDFESLLNQDYKLACSRGDLSIEDVKQLLAYKIDMDDNGNIKKKKILQTVKNIEIILENDRRFANKICFNEFSHQDCLVGVVPWEQKETVRAWSSFDDSSLYSILQSDYGMNSRNDMFDALKNVSRRRRFHPIKELLDSLKWDKKERIKSLLPDYLGVESTEYTYNVMRLFMLGAVARIYSPGYKFDYTMILQGKQGLGKSTFLQRLALDDEWFNDSLDSLDSDKAAQLLMGSWIIELAELKSLARTSGGADSIKRFLSATQDRYRIPYERRADVFLRQCVFAGTTNKFEFLQDETGNRRFLVIKTGVNNPTKSLFKPEVMEEFRQAWAEAVYIWKNERPELILPDSCKEEAEQLQENSMAEDTRKGIIEEYLKDKDRVCVSEIWVEALGENGSPKRWQSSEINAILNGLSGWERMKSPGRFGKYGQQRGFQRVYKSNVNVDNDVFVDMNVNLENPFT